MATSNQTEPGAPGGASKLAAPLSAGLGILTGILVTVALAQLRPATHGAAARTTAPAAEIDQTPPARLAPGPRPVWLTEKDQRPPAESPPAVPRSPLDLEEAGRAIRADFARQVAAHQAQTADPRWATTATASVRQLIDSLHGSIKVSLASADCRATSCLLTLEWPSQAEARSTYEEVLHHDFPLRCARTLLLSEPAAGQTRGQAQMLLDCST